MYSAPSQRRADRGKKAGEGEGLGIQILLQTLRKTMMSLTTGRTTPRLKQS